MRAAASGSRAKELGPEIRADRGLLGRRAHRGHGGERVEVEVLSAARPPVDERPALERGDWVLCDRFTDATFAYQGAGRGLAESHIRHLQMQVQGDLQPDLTLLIDVPVALGLRRARARRGDAVRDRFEREQEEFFTRVRECFLARARAEPQRIKVVDGNQPIDSVTVALQRRVTALMSSQ